MHSSIEVPEVSERAEPGRTNLHWQRWWSYGKLRGEAMLQRERAQGWPNGRWQRRGGGQRWQVEAEVIFVDLSDRRQPKRAIVVEAS